MHLVQSQRKERKSILYHDSFWYPSHQEIVHQLLGSMWGRLFANWENLELPPDDLETAGWKDVGETPAELHKETLKLVAKSFKILGSCVREAPEFAARKRRIEARNSKDAS